MLLNSILIEFSLHGNQATKTMRPSSPYHSTTHNAGIAALAIPVLGVVYGDIGTSPLYTLRVCLNANNVDVVQPVVFGVLSLIFWTLMLVVTIKYVIFIMQADNQGEGGIMALLALALRSAKPPAHARRVLLAIGLAGAALFYGDAIITPAISVLSAIEGIEVVTPVFTPYVIPITLVFVIILFTLQSHGTASVGRLFGPIMLVWFLCIGAIGLVKILEYPKVMAALNPIHAFYYVKDHGGYQSLLMLGGVVLAVTGAEALYADMGHFGPKPIRFTWFYIVFPTLILNYFGQGATVLLSPETVKNPFFLMFPANLQLPMVILSTAATIIASQSVISGTYSLSQQAVQLGFLPRIRVLHTSASESGQIYVPSMNGFLLVAIMFLVLGFGSSARLAAAYGIAVTGTMLMTTLLFYVVAVYAFEWKKRVVIPIVGGLILIDSTLFGANLLKIFEGGWIPLTIALFVFILMSTWYTGRILLYKRLLPKQPLDIFLAEVVPTFRERVSGTAVYLAAPREGVPNALLKNIRHNKVLHQKNIILTIVVSKRPWEKESNRYVGQVLGEQFYLVRARFGFMEMPDVPKIIEACRSLGLLDYDDEDISYFVSRLRPLPTDRPGMALWREKLFAIMRRNTAHAPDFFNIPPEKVVELDMQLDI